MFRALLWKEWRQLALVRWGGIALGALIPVAFLTGGELAKRGWLPTGAVKSYAARDLMYEALPVVLAVALWPLIGLMSAAQSFTGDRAAGTEAFLLERPVSRGSVWRARLVASLGSLVAVIVVTAAFAAAAAALAGTDPRIGWSRFVLLPSVGLGMGLLALLGGLVAASLLSSPLGAVLLGAVLAAVPLVLAAQLSTIFSMARIGSVPLGAIVTLLLIPAWIAASWIALCVGEPAGRGRVRRTVMFLVAALVSVLVLFGGSAPIVLRINAGMGQHSGTPSPTGGHVFVSADGGEFEGSAGWLVDVESARKGVFVPPPIRRIAWSPDGTKLAVLTWSGPLGSVRDRERIDIRSAGDGRVQRSIPVDVYDVVGDLAWGDGGLVTVAMREVTESRVECEVAIVDPDSGTWRPTGFRSAGWSMSLVRPLKDGRVFLSKAVEENLAVGSPAPLGYHLRPIDIVAASVGPPMADVVGVPIAFAGWVGSLSLSGRFARILGDDREQGRIVDLTAGPDRPAFASPPKLRWISGDRFVWIDDFEHNTRLFVGTPGAPPKVVREWRDSKVGLEPSPDGQAVFVSVLPSGAPPATDANLQLPAAALFEGVADTGASPEELVYFPDEDRVLSLVPPFSDRSNDHRYTQWAGPKTLARIAPGVVFFEDVDAPGKRRFALGGPRDLE
jgi:hypothetical protein